MNNVTALLAENDGNLILVARQLAKTEPDYFLKLLDSALSTKDKPNAVKEKRSRTDQFLEDNLHHIKNHKEEAVREAIFEHFKWHSNSIAASYMIDMLFWGHSNIAIDLPYRNQTQFVVDKKNELLQKGCK